MFYVIVGIWAIASIIICMVNPRKRAEFLGVFHRHS